MANQPHFLRRLLVLIGASLALAGCLTPRPDISQSRSPCITQPGGWCDFVRDAAVRAWPYAMLSTQAYEDEDAYSALPAAFEQRQAVIDDGTGLAYLVFDRFEMDGAERRELAARVIAFRGTDAGSVTDLFSGSFGTSQIELARKVLAVERADMAENGLGDLPVEVTGHSLGGALATQLSIENPSLTAFTFNTSPLVGSGISTNDTNRLAISEYGEFLRLIRRYREPLAADSIVVNCNPTRSAGQKHAIRELSDCLVWIAAYRDLDALKMVQLNGVQKPEVECGRANKVHPSYESFLYRPGEQRPVCRHSVGDSSVD